jgi:hypothetical protein
VRTAFEYYQKIVAFSWELEIAHAPFGLATISRRKNQLSPDERVFYKLEPNRNRKLMYYFGFCNRVVAQRANGLKGWNGEAFHRSRLAYAKLNTKGITHEKSSSGLEGTASFFGDQDPEAPTIRCGRKDSDKKAL